MNCCLQPLNPYIKSTSTRQQIKRSLVFRVGLQWKFLAKITSLLAAADKSIWLAQTYLSYSAQEGLLYSVDTDFLSNTGHTTLRWWGGISEEWKRFWCYVWQTFCVWIMVCLCACTCVYEHMKFCGGLCGKQYSQIISLMSCGGCWMFITGNIIVIAYGKKLLVE